MKIKLFFYHEQWKWDKEGKIVTWHLKVAKELSGPRLLIFLCEHEIEVPYIELLSESTIKKITASKSRTRNLMER